MATTSQMEEASLFLMQSSLGADYALIEHVANYSGGIESWLDNQLTHSVSDTGTKNTDDTFYNRTNEIWLDFKSQAIKASGDNGTGNIIGKGNATLPYNFYWRMSWWHRTLAKNHSTLANKNYTNSDGKSFDTTNPKENNSENIVRHRIAQALSEILVISDKSILELDALGMADFYDILYKGAFGNYNDLLKKVSLHPTMGVFLTHLNNKKEDPTNNIHPDENYAREIMQLFTIGLNELDPNTGVEKKDNTGNYIPTYNNDDIKQLAKVFTGIRGDSYNYVWPNQITGFTQDGNILLNDGGTKNHKTIPFINMIKPMKQDSEGQHDVTEKKLFHHSGKKYTATIGAGGSLDADITSAVNQLVAHPNTKYFIAKKLIQQLVTSNPSQGYIQAVASKFGSNGDLKAVIKEILIHAEARSTSSKKLKSPLFRVTQLLRAFNVKNTSGKLWVRGDMVDSLLQHHVLSSPTVFNFYLPDFAPHGDIENANQVAPEFQLHNSATSIAYTNMMYALLFSSDNKISLLVPTLIDNPNFFKTKDTTGSSDKLEFDFTQELALVNNAKNAHNANNYSLRDSHLNTLIRRISLILTGKESCPIEAELKTMIDTNIGYGTPIWVVQSIVFLILCTPQFTIQRKR